MEAYEAAGGVIIRDLFDEEGGGYFSNAELLDRLVIEKLTAEAVTLSAEGWKWVKGNPEFDYRLASGLRRIYPRPLPLSEEEQAKLDTLEAEYEALSVQHDGEISDEVAGAFERLEIEIDALKGREEYEPDAVARAGAFLSLGHDGAVRIERGFILRKMSRSAAPGAAHPDADETGDAICADEGRTTRATSRTMPRRYRIGSSQSFRPIARRASEMHWPKVGCGAYRYRPCPCRTELLSRP